MLQVEVRDDANYTHFQYSFDQAMPMPEPGQRLWIEGQSYEVISLVWEFWRGESWDDDGKKKFDAASVTIYVNRTKE